jgi:hypothetical protein
MIPALQCARRRPGRSPERCAAPAESAPTGSGWPARLCQPPSSPTAQRRRPAAWMQPPHRNKARSNHGTKLDVTWLQSATLAPQRSHVQAGRGGAWRRLWGPPPRSERPTGCRHWPPADCQIQTEGHLFLPIQRASRPVARSVTPQENVVGTIGAGDPDSEGPPRVDDVRQVEAKFARALQWAGRRASGRPCPPDLVPHQLKSARAAPHPAPRASRSTHDSRARPPRPPGLTTTMSPCRGQDHDDVTLWWLRGTAPCDR